MSETAAKFVSSVEGALRGLASGISEDVYLNNVRAGVQNGLYHAARTPEIDASAGRLLMLAQNYDRQPGSARAQYIEQLRASYLTLRELLLAAKPSEISSALGL